MKSKLLIGMSICVLLNVFGVLVFNRLTVEPRDRLKLWMTLEEVKQVMPFEDRHLLANPMADYDNYYENRGIENVPQRTAPLHLQYGVTIGFNMDDRLVLINRVDSAEIEVIKSSSSGGGSDRGNR
jgi:hypothetical protein